jgi:hypothetical protein
MEGFSSRWHTDMASMPDQPLYEPYLHASFLEDSATCEY